MSPILTCMDGTKQNCNISAVINIELNLNALIGSAIARNQLSNVDVILRFTKDETTIWKWQNNQLIGVSAKNDSLLKSSTLVSGKIPVIKVNSSEWQVFINPERISTWLLPSFQQIKVLLFGLVLVVLLSAYLQALYRHDQVIIDNQAKLEQEIDAQTKALRLANETLTTEIKNKEHSQEQLKASEAHKRTLLDNLPYPVWFKSPEGAYLSFNKIVSDLFNKNEADIIGKHAGNYVDSDLEALLRDYEKAVLESKEAIKREIWMHIPQLNQQRLMDIIKVAVRDEAGIPLGILSIARDITEQHQLINELEKFKRFAEYASEGFSIMTLTAETLYMNRSMQKILSSEHTPAHNDFYSYFPSDLQPQWRDKIFPYLLLNGYWQGELAALRADGSRFPTKETFFIIRDDKGKPIYLGEVMIDISEQKRTEESLQLAKETAEEATRAKSRFLANMSHEIRTPLNAVLGYSQLLIADKQLSPQQHERMNAILMAGQRLLHLINDILDLSKIEAGALHVRDDYFDLHQELNDIASLMRTKAIAKGLILNYKDQLPTPAIVKSDKQKIGQIILNLLGNAIKFTPGGEINLHVTHNDRGILIDVIDTGPGISAQELQLLFTAFKQGKAGEEFGGTGLGLVISKNIAEKLGGELRLDSEPGKGTHAHLHLPLSIHFDTRLENTLNTIQARLTQDSHCSVLVVEDDKASRDVLVNLLRDTGCHVLEAATGSEGLAKALASNPDIIFTDIRMPELSGSDMLKELRKKIAYDDMPVIAVSASSLEHERTFYLSQGFHEFISKPYQFSDIYAALQKFTHAQFLQSQQTQVEPVGDKKILTASELEELQTQLNALKESLNKGDMNTSKKLFAQQNVQNLGSEAHQKIHNAIRQYDLVLAETFVDEVITTINDELNHYKS
ncbi:MAG: ATP-binding protein [Cellvibrio sp.]